MSGRAMRGAEVILALVNRAGLEHRENEIAREFLAQIVDVALARAGAQRLGFEAVEFLLLADVGAKGDDLRGVGFLQPGEQDGGIEPPGISDDDFHKRGI